MAQATFSVSVDEVLKNQFEISAPSKITLEEGGDAFLNLRQSAKENDLQDMTLDEINAEIQLARNF